MHGEDNSCGTKDDLLGTLLTNSSTKMGDLQVYSRSLAQYQQTSCCATAWPCGYESEPGAPSAEWLGVCLSRRGFRSLGVEVETMVSLVLMMPELVFTKRGDPEDRRTAWTPERAAS